VKGASASGAVQTRELKCRSSVERREPPPPLDDRDSHGDSDEANLKLANGGDHDDDGRAT
jgi:hypothetical protein